MGNATRSMSSGSAAQIVVKDVTKEYRSKAGLTQVALSNVSLSCAQGEFIALLGPSGCGKTTLLNMIAGLDHPTTGEVTFEGKTIIKPGAERGVIFQHYSLFPWLTVKQNIEFGLRYVDQSKEAKRDVVDKYLGMVGLSDASDRLPKELSGGMRQRCALARALVMGPQTLLMDEPFGALDAITRRQLQFDLLRIYKAEKMTIVFVTHDVDEAVLLSQRIVIMVTGPGRIQEVIDVELPHERGPDLLKSDDFVEMRRKVWERMPGLLDGDDGTDVHRADGSRTVFQNAE